MQIAGMYAYVTPIFFDRQLCWWKTRKFTFSSVDVASTSLRRCCHSTTVLRILLSLAVVAVARIFTPRPLSCLCLLGRAQLLLPLLLLLAYFSCFIIVADSIFVFVVAFYY
ncbi:unnamed protein product [Ceratitis capitata]|uniref:(Mediterranean fruit fly) hypothetical protein n=1 Tax=Ceratitis capitata TaxID=7213 RepID=A0A811UMC7_CERCA|nr:unnamed protein product [Ceratitis capitata]